MKIEVIDSYVNFENSSNVEKERVTFILDVFNDLDQFDTIYTVYGKEQVSNDVATLILDKGLSILPLTLIDNLVVKKGDYPSNSDFESYTGISFEIMDETEFENHEHHHDEEGICSCGRHH